MHDCQCAEVLFARGADPYALNERTQHSALHVAIYQGICVAEMKAAMLTVHGMESGCQVEETWNYEASIDHEIELQKRRREGNPLTPEQERKWRDGMTDAQIHAEIARRPERVCCYSEPGFPERCSSDGGAL